MSTNMERLSDVLSGRMKKTSSAAVPTTLELGVINHNLSLTTDSIPTPIPRGDYMVDIMLAGGATSADTHSHDGGESYTHSHGFRSLQAGDRVLVAWCGNEPVVLAVVISS